MQFVDAAKIAGTRLTSDGYLVAEVRTARTGIQDYAGYEVGKAVMPVVKVYRPPEQVFSKDSLGSYAHKPITNDHPSEAVTADNWRSLAVGQIGDEIARDGDYVRIPLVLMDADTIKQVQDGKRELSAGYVCSLDWTAGKTPEGEAYDAIQKDIRINHVAIVDRGRAGSQARIGDGAKWGIAPISDAIQKEVKPMTLKTVTVDGIPVEVTDQGAVVISTLQTRLSAADKKLSDAEAAHKAALTAKDEEIGTLKADLKKAQDAALKPEDVDRLVADRAALVETIKAIDSKIEIKGSDAELRRAAVKSRLGDEMVKDASDAEVSGMFKAIAKDMKQADPFRDAMKGGVKQPVNDRQAASDAYAGYVENLRNGWNAEAAQK
ncbi:MAG: DUF2213 domain-containing protein [Allorhizobium sp.]